jgi:cation transporter-like permease
MTTFLAILLLLFGSLLLMGLIGWLFVYLFGEESAGPIFASLFVYGMVVYMIFLIDPYIGAYFIVIPAALFFIYVATKAVQKITGY